MTIRTRDGKLFSAADDQDLVHQLREDSFTPSEDAGDFMRQCAERGGKMGQSIRVGDARSFVEDMISEGEIILVN